MTYVIAQPCVDLKDRACVEECPVDCIYEGKRMLYIHPDECVDCGACEPVCPVEAIFYEDDTPEEWKPYYNANVEFFDDLGSPGGAAKIGVDRQGPPAGRRAAAARARRVRLPRSGGHPARASGRSDVVSLAAGLPDFPWDTLAAAKARAAAHPDGLVDLSVGTPVDPTPELGRRALAAPPTARATRRPRARRSCGRRWPTTSPGAGAPRAAAGRHPAGDRHQGARRLAADPARARARRPGRLPTMAYPTYLVGAPIAGCRTLAVDDLGRPRRRAARPGLAQLPVQPDGADARARRCSPPGWPGPASAARWSPPTSATASSAGRPSRSRCCTPTSAAATTAACWPCTRCPSAPTWPATGPASSPGTRPWSPSCWPSASTPG